MPSSSNAIPLNVVKSTACILHHGNVCWFISWSNASWMPMMRIRGGTWRNGFFLGNMAGLISSLLLIWGSRGTWQYTPTSRYILRMHHLIPLFIFFDNYHIAIWACLRPCPWMILSISRARWIGSAIIVLLLKHYWWSPNNSSLFDINTELFFTHQHLLLLH